MENIITVTVEGGIVQAIDGIPPGVIIRILDFDIEGAQENAITTLPDGQKAVVNQWGNASEDTT